MIGNVVDSCLYVYQEYCGFHHQIESCYKIINYYEYGFDIQDNYNPNEALVIDPLLGFSTFIGGTSDELAIGITIDSEGNCYGVSLIMSVNAEPMAVIDTGREINILVFLNFFEFIRADHRN